MRKHYFKFPKIASYTLLMSLFFMVAPCDMKAQVRKLSQRTAAAPNSVIYNIKETLR
jgi:hypothetical protein